MDFAKITEEINGLIWGAPMIILLFGTHIFMTIRTKFIQKKLFKGIKLSLAKDDNGAGEISQFGALTTALAATIGTGNIIGVATAISLGGPGAILWMWLIGIFGMATKYAETLIAVKYRVKNAKGAMQGGAMYALERGLNMKWLGIIFALLAALAGFGIGCMTQANSISTALYENFNLPPWITGAFTSTLVAIVILGGVKSITRVCEKLVPFMAVFYVVGCVILLVINSAHILPAFELIIKSAFSEQAGAGGLLGFAVTSAIRFGCARGLFSNESGMGSAPLVATAAKTKNPVRQALVSMTGTFWDTVIICLLTGLVLVSSVLADPALNAVIANKKVLTFSAFAQIPVIGQMLITASLSIFAFSTILGWSYYGERGAEYLFGRKIIIPYRILWIICVFIGTKEQLNTVWYIADSLNGLMAIPNLIALFLLHKVIAAEGDKYLEDIDKEDDTDIPTVG